MANDYFADTNFYYKLLFMTRDEYFQKLLEMFCEHIEASTADEEDEIEEEILAFIEDNEVPDKIDLTQK